MKSAAIDAVSIKLKLMIKEKGKSYRSIGNIYLVRWYSNAWLPSEYQQGVCWMGWLHLPSIRPASDVSGQVWTYSRHRACVGIRDRSTTLTREQRGPGRGGCRRRWHAPSVTKGQWACVRSYPHCNRQPRYPPTTRENQRRERWKWSRKFKLEPSIKIRSWWTPKRYMVIAGEHHWEKSRRCPGCPYGYTWHPRWPRVPQHWPRTGRKRELEANGWQ